MEERKQVMGKINVAIIGVGNCASSLVQGIHYYRKVKEGESVPGLMHINLGGYHINHINFVAAFDIDKNKVGKTWPRPFSLNPIILSSFVTYLAPGSK
jgi:myo-inositol-1-phosphate synthase